MSIVKFVRNRKYPHQSLAAVILFTIVFMLAAACFPGAVYAAGVGDVVTEVANNNYQSPEFNFGAENVTGYGFKTHAAYGGYGQGYSGVTVLGPVNSGDMDILLQYVDSEAQHTNMQTEKMQGCEVREYTLEEGNGIGVILPDYFITVETYRSGNSRAADLDHAKHIAQQVLNGMEKSGLLSQSAPQLEGAPADEPLAAETPAGTEAEQTPAQQPAEQSAKQGSKSSGTHVHTASPAGVGSVGNIPGPSNTTEAVVGVAVPGLIAIGLSILAGAGGGLTGGYTPPLGSGSGGPAASGAYPETDLASAETPFAGQQAAGSQGSGNRPAGMEQETAMLGRRRREGTKIDTAEMSRRGTITEPGGGGVQNEAAQPGELSVFGQAVELEDAESGWVAESVQNSGSGTDVWPKQAPISSEAAGLAVPEGSGMIIDTSAFELSEQKDSLPAAGAAGMDGLNGTAGSEAVSGGVEIDTSGFGSSGSGSATGGAQQDGALSEIYDQQGYDRDGYDREGYDRNGLNKDGFDREGYDREGFDYEGYNREGYDPWGYDKHGYGKDGYHWSGYNADGYDRNGRYWSENPYGEGSPFAIGYQDPFDERNVIPYGADWKPTKPSLGEPYPKTLEKYGAKPWTDEPDVPESTGRSDSTQAGAQVEPESASGQDDSLTMPETKIVR